MTEELSYRLLKLLEANPTISQRELARELGISVGKSNYCLQGLAEKGWVKAGNFRTSRNKLAYVYLLTPKGIEEKARVTLRFLQRRLAEYEIMRREIAELQLEVAGMRVGQDGTGNRALVPENSER